MTAPVALNGSQSVDRALGLLTMVGRHGDRGVTLSGLVEEAGLNKPTTRRLLLALIRGGLVEQDGDSRRYYLGEGAYVLGSLASRRFGLLEISRDSLIRLSKQTQDTSFLSIRRDTHSVCLHREEGSFPIRTHVLQAGMEHPLGCGAGSLALLSALRDQEVESILAANEPILRDRYPMCMPDRLRQDVRETRTRGFSLNPGLIVANSWGMGVAVRFPDGRPAGALSIAAIDSRMQPPRREEIAALLRDEASRIEKKLDRMFGSIAAQAEGSPARRPARRSTR
nr:IclR family transcriptional regulator [Lutibaculum baratangense]